MRVSKDIGAGLSVVQRRLRGVQSGRLRHDYSILCVEDHSWD